MKTRADLVARTLKALGVLGAGQDPSPEDAGDVDALIGPKLDELAARGVIVIADPDAIDDAVFLSLAAVMAWAAASMFGVATPIGVPALVDAENALRRVQQVGPYDEPVPGVYF